MCIADVLSRVSILELLVSLGKDRLQAIVLLLVRMDKFGHVLHSAFIRLLAASHGVAEPSESSTP